MESPGNVLVGTWTLSNTDSTPAASVLMLDAPFNAAESVFKDDARKVVSPRDFQPSGKYGAIVKLQIRYEGQSQDDDRWAHATGWLITNDVFVTAGHCVFDWSHGFNKAVQIKAYTGYNGKASIGKPTVQFRQGKRIATSRGWLKSAANRDNDVAFVQVDKAFNGITPFKFVETPAKGTKLQLGVVGYPIDRSLQDEKGAQMYEQFDPTTFDLTTSVKHMLEYKVSTFAGQSGSPVLLQGKNVSIGAHVYGLGTVNSASIVDGTWGNPYSAYLNSFKIDESGSVNSFGTRYIEVPLTQASTTTTDQSFLETLANIVKIGGTVGPAALQAGTLFLGPSGQNIAAAAGTALNFAVQLTDSSMQSESTLDVDYSFQAPASRSIMAEAALQTVLSMDEDQLSKYNVFKKMQAVYDKEKSNIAPIATKIMPAIMGPALQIAAYSAHQERFGAKESGFEYPPMTSAPRDGKTLSQAEQRFITQLGEIAKQVGSNEEGFLEFLGGIAKNALGVVSPGLGAIGSIIGGGLETESDLDFAVPLDPNLVTLSQRAIVAEAALQAIIRIPTTDMWEEGFFDSLIGIVEKVAPVVIQVAPSIVGAVTPVVKGLLRRNPETAFGKKKQSIGQ